MNVICSKLDMLFQIKMLKILKDHHIDQEHDAKDYRFCELCKLKNDRLFCEFAKYAQPEIEELKKEEVKKIEKIIEV